MGISRSQTIFVALAPGQVWDLISDPGAWLQWNDQLQQFAPVEMASDRLQVGDTVKVVPKALIRGFIHAATAPPATIVLARPQREIVWRQDQPGGYTQQSWQIEPASEGGTYLTRRTLVVGPLAAPLATALAAPLTQDLGAVGARMFQMACAGPNIDQPVNVVVGGSGYLGSRLVTRLLAAGQRAVVLTRSPRSGAPYPQAGWDHDNLGQLDDHLMDPAGFNIINLAGRPLGPEFTPTEVARQEISRVETTATLRSAVSAARARGGVLHRWLQGSAVPLWSADSTKEFTETTSPTADEDGPDGMGQLVADWEASAPDDAIILRTGVVLGQQAQISMGLIAMALTKTRPRIDGYLPWIHEDDWVGIVQHLLSTPNPPSTVVAVAPQQTRLSEAIHALAPSTGPRHFPIPAKLLSWGMKCIRMEPGLLLGSTKARSTVLMESGYTYRFPTIAAAADAVTF
ncbi:DUF1731 domain-containing protein [Yaniella halotolerans]|uniref:DUF1731 domain-containing protein n=1 Tax=Yaniella halotolerans TaxID=225453 RepID=UPI0003B60A08|nr:DUF1731 domain-containing protein [Yaniella halotolerans]